MMTEIEKIKHIGEMLSEVGNIYKKNELINLAESLMRNVQYDKYNAYLIAYNIIFDKIDEEQNKETELEIFADNDKIKDIIRDMYSRMQDYIKYLGANRPIIYCCVLDGGFMIFSDLVSISEHNGYIDFIKVKTYDGNIKVSDEYKKVNPVSITTGLDNPIIFIIDDIVDSGDTAIKVAEAYNIFYKEKCDLVLVSAVTRENIEKAWRINELYTHWVAGFVANKDGFIVGYGMDDLEGKMRHSPHMYYLKGVKVNNG